MIIDGYNSAQAYYMHVEHAYFARITLTLSQFNAEDKKKLLHRLND